jgi:hypothetical protein
MKERILLIDQSSKVSLRLQCKLLNVSRNSLYYKPVGESEENILLTRALAGKYPHTFTIRLHNFIKEKRC